MSTNNPDAELEAIQQVLTALEALESDARQRVIDYVFQRLGLARSTSVNAAAFGAGTQWRGAESSSESPIETATEAIVDIRNLRASKSPKTDNEMAALVAYYLKHHAPSDEKKDAISTADLEKYFVQAGYPLPKQPRFTLQNAKNAGYFDPAGRGLFRLNPVGHNLVAHGLKSGGGGQPTAKTKRTTRKPPAKKKPRKT
jgi:hypothetical protein